MKFLYLFLFLTPMLGADLTITAQAPLFVNLNDSYQGKVEAAVAEELSSRRGEILSLVDAFLNKPRFLSSFAGAVGLKSSLPGVWITGKLGVLTLGGEASAVVDTWDIPDLISRAQALNQSSDEPWGGFLRPLGGNLAFRLPELPGVLGPLELLGMAGGGFFPYADQDYQADFREAWLGASGVWGQGGVLFPGVAWEGLRGTASLRWQNARILVDIPLDPFSQRVNPEIAPGIFFPVTLEIIPQFQGGLEWGGWTVPLAMDTAVRLGDTFLISLGGGAVVSLVRAGLVLDGSAVVTLPASSRGLITDDSGVEHPGKVSLSGDLEAREAPLLSGVITASFQLVLGSFVLQVPVVWAPTTNLATGVFLGMDL